MTDQPINSSMMSLGLFVFTMKTGLYSKLTNDLEIVWHSKQALALGPVYQFGGVGSHTISLSGSIVPAISGQAASIDKLKTMAMQGKSWNLMDGQGKDLGAWIINNVSATHTHMDGQGIARQIDFTLSLTEDPDLKKLGKLKDSA